MTIYRDLNQVVYKLIDLEFSRREPEEVSKVCGELRREVNAILDKMAFGQYDVSVAGGRLVEETSPGYRAAIPSAAPNLCSGCDRPLTVCQKDGDCLALSQRLYPRIEGETQADREGFLP